MSDEELIDKCASMAAALERNPKDFRLELDFRRAVESYTAMLQQRIADGGGIAAEDLHGALEADAAQCTVDLDLRFLGKAALSEQAARLHASVANDGASGSG